MRCPYCGSELYQGARFCNACGAPAAGFYPPVQMRELKKKSRSEEIGIAILKTVCFVMYFFRIQTVVTMVYILSLFSRNIHVLMSPGGDMIGTANEILSLMGQGIHETLIVSGILTILVLGLIYALRGMRMSKEIRLTKASPVLLLKVAVCAVAMQYFTVILLSIIPIPESVFQSLEQSSNILMGGSLIMQIINIAIITPIVEEVIFRGFIYTRLRKALTVLPSVLISGMVFGVVHGNIIGFFYASALGFFMAMLIERFDSIIPCMVCHMFFNGASLSTALFPETDAFMWVLFGASAIVMGLLLYMIFKGTSPRIKQNFDNYTTDV